MKCLRKGLLVLGSAVLLTGCGSSSSDENTLVVSATLDPHSVILEEAAVILEEDYGITLEIEILDDYYVFNKALDDGDVDANYFQHLPFFESEVETNGYDIVNVGGIHIEPFGIYSSVYDDVSEVEDGAQIIISNSISDNGRILSILADAGLIVLPDDIDVLDLTIADIDNDTNNPNGYEFLEIDPELLVYTFDLGEGDLVAINGNYAIQGGLNPTTDSLILEEADQDNPYVNIVATRSELADDERILALVEVLQSEEIQNFILETYSDGSVIPASN
ncbi:MetQ/NlpA family ABC transporter substrate-binding protein [Tannockella kyphosi]|uniref:MetQ/NlpA family ABC transporter substrate-binding protein n=1 Tax=Tannockella kyphosi TaxID=2899121 RepID=UPI00201120BE|nr:MetQ/NlpA family ABC transporter substrate-binding protein [Tannockella kyphosi]